MTRFVAVCNAVGYAHSRGVIHRDLKPSNVMLGPYGETLVVDWGLAKTLFDAEASTQPYPPATPGLSDPADTQPGHPVGTPAFMSPEQARGEHNRVGPAADIFSLGATLYSVLTGESPRSGPAEGALAQAATGEAKPARQLNAKVPAALEAVCRKAMALRPESRYRSATELAGEVERWLADEPVGAYRDPWTAAAGRWPRRHRTLVAALTVLLVCAVVALSASTAAVAAEQRRTAKQKDLAEEAARRANENYEIARGLTDELVTIVETRLPQVGGVEPVRKALLDAALPAFNRFLAGRPDDPDLMVWTARLHRYAANLRRQTG